MKRWHYLALAAAILAVGVYLYVRSGTALGSLFSSGLERASAGSATGSQWHAIERPEDGFKIDLPGDFRGIQAPAYDESGGTEPVHMLVASPRSDVTYAVTWEDNPPVARAGHTTDRTLYMARDGMLARTETTIISETRGYHRDYPSLEVLARNNAGGILNARIVMADNRLYMLLALFPSSGARSEPAVNRFFNSLVPARPSSIPETMPAASTE